ncbi:hypothetical protein NL676_022273 [Syzygium grande]|nr:hypothetical protein NL676_022273 [Syzygium grande]
MSMAPELVSASVKPVAPANFVSQAYTYVTFLAGNGSKPWRYTVQEDTDNTQREDIKMRVKKLGNFAVKEDIKMLVNKWWDIYQDESLDYKNWVWRPRKRPSRSTGRPGSGPSKRSAQ